MPITCKKVDLNDAEVCVWVPDEIIDIDIIQCPECNLIQAAPVTASYPWATYIKECDKCTYIIMESEWNSFYYKSKNKIMQTNEIIQCINALSPLINDGSNLSSDVQSKISKKIQEFIEMLPTDVVNKIEVGKPLQAMSMPGEFQTGQVKEYFDNDPANVIRESDTEMLIRTRDEYQQKWLSVENELATLRKEKQDYKNMLQACEKALKQESQSHKDLEKRFEAVSINYSNEHIARISAEKQVSAADIIIGNLKNEIKAYETTVENGKVQLSEFDKALTELRGSYFAVVQQRDDANKLSLEKSRALGQAVRKLQTIKDSITHTNSEHIILLIKEILQD